MVGRLLSAALVGCVALVGAVAAAPAARAATPCGSAPVALCVVVDGGSPTVVTVGQIKAWTDVGRDRPQYYPVRGDEGNGPDEPVSGASVTAVLSGGFAGVDARYVRISTPSPAHDVVLSPAALQPDDDGLVPVFPLDPKDDTVGFIRPLRSRSDNNQRDLTAPGNATNLIMRVSTKGEALTPELAVDDSTPAAGDDVVFTVSGTPTSANYHWEFGAGSTDTTSPRTTHRYDRGSYAPYVTVTDGDSYGESEPLDLQVGPPVPTTETTKPGGGGKATTGPVRGPVDGNGRQTGAPPGNGTGTATGTASGTASAGGASGTAAASAGAAASSAGSRSAAGSDDLEVVSGLLLAGGQQRAAAPPAAAPAVRRGGKASPPEGSTDLGWLGVLILPALIAAGVLLERRRPGRRPARAA